MIKSHPLSPDVSALHSLSPSHIQSWLRPKWKVARWMSRIRDRDKDREREQPHASSSLQESRHSWFMSDQDQQGGRTTAAWLGPLELLSYPEYPTENPLLLETQLKWSFDSNGTNSWIISPRDGHWAEQGRSAIIKIKQWCHNTVLQLNGICCECVCVCMVSGIITRK